MSETNGVMLNAAEVARDVIVVGASAGGIAAASALFRMIPSDLLAIKAVVLHRSPYASTRLASVLERLSGQHVIEPEDGARLVPGAVYLAPADMHLTLARDHAVLTRGVHEHSTRPSVDPLFRSAAAAFGRRVLGILLSGAGDDGVLGLMRIKAAGGIAIVQWPGEAEHASMPTNALRHDRVDAALPLHKMAAVIPCLARGERVESAA